MQFPRRAFELPRLDRRPIMSNRKIVTAPITDLANDFADFVASLDVDHLWQRAKAVNWETYPA